MRNAQSCDKPLIVPSPHQSIAPEQASNQPRRLDLIHAEICTKLYC
jgi:hypothetical protein